MGLRIVEIAGAFPEAILGNALLQAEFLAIKPEGAQEFQRVADKTGIVSRHVVDRVTTALDLAEIAAVRLRDFVPAEFAQVDFIIHCTQSPDYILPTSACILHSRLGLPEDVGAMDVNLGCSGFVYCLSLADGLLRAGHARKVLVTTADTYTRYIHPRDIANRIIFGDAAAATLLENDESVAPARFLPWSDGGSARHLIIQNGGSRQSGRVAPDVDPEVFSPPDPSCLYMNGNEIFKFAIMKIPALINRFLEKHNVALDDYDGFVPHQANAYMLEELNKRVKFPSERVVQHFATIGNTVSASIPLAIEAYLRDGRLKRGSRLLLAGFGVGLSAAIGEVEL